MPYKVDNMNVNEIDEMINHWYVETYRMSLDEIRHMIVKSSIDFTGKLSEFVLHIRTLGDYISFIMDIYKKGFDVRFLEDRCIYEFPIYYFRDMPSGRGLGRKMPNGDYEVLDGMGCVLKYISHVDLKYQLIDDLLKDNYMNFNEKFKEFLKALYNWAHEMEQ